MAKIRILSDHLASQIAAGEVVERPAAVVKELLENALDAGAQRAEIELDAGGKRRILVSDDGVGMGQDDALLAFDRHATSKIETYEDLEQVGSFGFRGEALASIAAVARVELTTAEQAGDGVRVRIEGGRVQSVQPVAHPRGTRIEIRSLFFNVPARRKFLKTPATELRHSTAVIQAYALARPDLQVLFRHQDRTLLDLAPAQGEGGTRQRVGQIFGAEFADGLQVMPVTPTPDAGRVWGLIGGPDSARSRRRFAFVNRRLVRDRAVMASFYRAVRDTWRSEDFPALFLFFDLAPEAVDVNVHPQKSEVRFRDNAVLDCAVRAMRGGLEAALGEISGRFTPATGGPAMPLAWQGLGERAGSSSFASSVAESAATTDAFRLAQAAYAPLERRPVPLAGRGGEVRPFRLLGQYKGTMILLEGPDGLYIIDQHVAHERILFERIRRSMQAEVPSCQKLLQPLMLELAADEAMRLADNQAALAACGFHLSVLSGGTIALSEVPAGLDTGQAERLLMRLASSQWESDDAESLAERVLEGLAADASCQAAVKMHEPLSAAELEALVSELFEAEQPYACPHGRPIVLRMTDADLESRFGRR